MNKQITIILALLVVIAGVYWLSSITPSSDDAMSPDENTQTQGTNNGGSAGNVSITEYGPLGVATGSSIGDYLVGPDGLTLYVKGSDASQTGTNIQTSCNAACEEIWPPYLFGENEPGITESDDSLLSKLNIFTRSDGKMQYALGNQPLYFYASDNKTGDILGDGISDWMIARP